MLIPRLDIEAAVCAHSTASRSHPADTHGSLQPQAGRQCILQTGDAAAYAFFQGARRIQCLDATLGRADERRGVVTASGGNHGLAVAYAAHVLDIPATVYLPESATDAKLAPLRLLGPEIVIYGACLGRRQCACDARSARVRQGLYPPFRQSRSHGGSGNRRDRNAAATARARPHRGLDRWRWTDLGNYLCDTAFFAGNPRCRRRDSRARIQCSRAGKPARIVELPSITSIAETLGARKTEPVQFDIVCRHAHRSRHSVGSLCHTGPAGNTEDRETSD